MGTERSTPTLATLLRLAVTGGRSDRLRIGLTAAGSAGATVGLLTAAAVAFIEADDGPYRLSVLDQPGLRPGVVTCLVLLTIPLLVLVGQCSRVGAPARDRRLAMLRMAGATPSEVRRIGGLETGVAGLLGSGLGLAGFVALRAVFDSTSPTTVTRTTEIIGANGSITIAAEEVAAMARLLPTDVAIPVWAVLLVLAALPLLTAATAVIALRKVALTPFGVVRSAPSRPPTVVPAVAAAVGTLGLALWTPVATRIVPESAGLGVVGAIALMLFASVAAGLLFGSASIAFALGGVVAPRTSNPALLVGRVGRWRLPTPRVGPRLRCCWPSSSAPPSRARERTSCSARTRRTASTPTPSP
ncbi:MAG: FtsX-like permease family protein [Ilumatobacteraceae bacterium]